MQPELQKTGPPPEEIGVTEQVEWVEIRPKGHDGLEIDRPKVTIRRRSKVKWKCVNLDKLIPDGGRLEIEFDEWNNIKGPFEEQRGNPAQNGRGRYRRNKMRPLIFDSNKADQIDNPPGEFRWKYTVTVYKTETGDEVFRGPEDPGIEIEEDGKTKD